MAPLPRSVAALVLLAGLVAQSAAAPQDGAVAYPGQFPWHAGVFRAKDNSFLGSGALVAPQYVLTAASTFFADAPGSDEVKVLLGAMNPTGSRYDKLPLSDIIVHANYPASSSNEYDIAVLVLTAPVLTVSVKPVRLPPRYYQGATYVDQTLSVTGWGTDKDGNSATTYLTVSNLAVIRNRECQEQQDPDVHFSWNKMCAVGTGPTPCKGDSGNPVVFLENDNEYTLVGLMTQATQCSTDRPSTITRITEFLDWIDVATNKAIPIKD